MTNAIEVTNLCKEYSEFLLDDISFTLPTGYIMGLVGKNGSGKTTTIQLMLNMIKAKSGSIKLLGKDHIIDEIDIKQDIAVVFDDTFVVDSWKVYEVEKAIHSFYKNWDSEFYSELLDSFHISKNKRVKELSCGMKMKLMLAIALSHKAKLVILDEPTSGLDPVARDELLDILMKYIDKENNSILFSSHITADLDKIADYITVINDGKLFYSGTKDGLFERYCLVKGDIKDISSDLRNHIIGLKNNANGFTGLLDIAHLKHVTKDMCTERVTIDDILIAIQ